MVTAVPDAPCVGVKLATIGGSGGVVTVKLAGLVAVPPAVVTVTVPVVAPVGTVVLI